MAPSNVSIPRRALLTGIAASSVLAPIDSSSEGKKTLSLISPENISAAKLAEDESFWRDIASHYSRIQGIVNLEHEYWGK